MKKNMSINEKIFNFLNIIFLTLMSIVFLYPILLTLSMSLSSNDYVIGRTVGLIPKGVNIQSYIFLLSDGRILRYYLNTIFYASTGTVISLLLTSMMAYPLTFRSFAWKKVISVLLTITLFFSGGLVPFYLLVTKLGMRNTIWVMILPGAISAWNVIIYKTFFMGIPVSLKEAAMIDGARHMKVLFKIILPLSKPLLATMALFSVVGFWNDFFTAVLFLNKSDMYPIQMLLRRILVLMDYKDVNNLDLTARLLLTNTRTVKSAAIIITIVPILCIYPFLQKYFTEGILVGSIKA